jgi:hypothetical protein
MFWHAALPNNTFFVKFLSLPDHKRNGAKAQGISIQQAGPALHAAPVGTSASYKRAEIM